MLWCKPWMGWRKLNIDDSTALGNLGNARINGGIHRAHENFINTVLFMVSDNHDPTLPLQQYHVSSSSSTVSSPLTTGASPTPHLHHALTIKLGTDNYLLWKTQILPLLGNQSLLGYVDGSLPAPPATITNLSTSTSTPNSEYSDWVLKDHLVLS
ncbi:hypothetical protein NE237_024868 [Protea cynaroides]|uniref:Retrotransposon Copia-like N-terminal domain-containing protein n=1 Tax=Protea cynaroides TaxID=273540 RepID=A0A9Q0H0U9_9MAGN|nr:hypothetical protein NE237_024868 [Protea cynaroides]